MCFIFNEGTGIPLDLLNPTYALTENSTPVWSSGSDGWGIDFERADSDYYELTQLWPLWTNQFSMFCKTIPESGQSNTGSPDWGHSVVAVSQDAGSSTTLHGLTIYNDSGVHKTYAMFNWSGNIAASDRETLIGDPVTMAEPVVFGCTYDQDKFRLYQDGKQANSVVNAAAAQVPDNARVGRFVRTNEGYFDGIIDWLFIWNRALSAAEVLELERDPYQMFMESAVAPWFGGLGVVERQRMIIMG